MHMYIEDRKKYRFGKYLSGHGSIALSGAGYRRSDAFARVRTSADASCRLNAAAALLSFRYTVYYIHKEDLHMKTIVKDTERGFLFKKGKFEKMLQPGIYHTFGSNEIRKAAIDKPLFMSFTEAQLSQFEKDEAFAAETVSVTVPDGKIALRFSDGAYRESLLTGKYILWNNVKKHTFGMYDITQPRVPDSIPRHICEKLCDEDRMISVSVPEYGKGLLYFDGSLEEILAPGVYYFWNHSTHIEWEVADTRQQQMTISGQEILTKDKVAVRLNFVCSYRLADFEKAFREIRDYASQFYIAVQMVVREQIASGTLDELLTQRETITAAITDRLKEKAAELYIEVIETGIRDIILPGEVREIMNTVLIAEKRAQANVITRREEVASTRSLLNTAKLMDENKTLYKLKELEYLERICENVGNISVSGGDLLTQLHNILGTRT